MPQTSEVSETSEVFLHQHPDGVFQKLRQRLHLRLRRLCSVADAAVNGDGGFHTPVQLWQFFEIGKVFQSSARFLVLLEIFQINQVDFHPIQFIYNSRLVALIKINA